MKTSSTAFTGGIPQTTECDHIRSQGKGSTWTSPKIFKFTVTIFNSILMNYYI